MENKDLFNIIKKEYQLQSTQDEFENIKTYYQLNLSNKNLLNSMIDDIKNKSVKKIIYNNKYQNIVLYENELLTGCKPNGKIIKEIKKGSYQYYYDELGRVILIEQLEDAAGSLIPYYINAYLYQDDCIFNIYISDYRNVVIRKYQLKENQINECYVYRAGSINLMELKEYIKYVYVNQRLCNCLFARNESNDINCSYKSLIYNDNNELVKIIRYCANGYNDVSYSNEKINYKKLEARIIEELQSIVYSLFNEHEIKYLAFNCCVEEGILEIYGDDSQSVNFNNIYEWKYNNLDTIPLINYPLSDLEYNKILFSCANAINILTSYDEFKKMAKSVVCIFYDHNTNSYLEIPDKIKNLLSSNKYFHFK